MTNPPYDRAHDAVLLRLPFTGRWLVQNSPARRVPSHGTDLYGLRFAIDFVGVDAQNRTSTRTDWRTALTVEPPERFVSYGRPVLAPVAGTVVAVHDGEPDHGGRRSPLTLIPYALTQASRVRRGVDAVAGNRVTIRDAVSGTYVTLVHLRRDSLRVARGDEVGLGTQIAQCGGSGNSTQPHVHVQVNDRLDLAAAQGVPLAFDAFREWPRGKAPATVREREVPTDRAVVAPVD